MPWQSARSLYAFCVIRGQSQRDCASKPRVASLRATLGGANPRPPTPTGLRRCGHNPGCNPVGVEVHSPMGSQGSSFLATLGLETESRRDSLFVLQSGNAYKEQGTAQRRHRFPTATDVLSISEAPSHDETEGRDGPFSDQLRSTGALQNANELPQRLLNCSLSLSRCAEGWAPCLEVQNQRWRRVRRHRYRNAKRARTKSSALFEF